MFGTILMITKVLFALHIQSVFAKVEMQEARKPGGGGRGGRFFGLFSIVSFPDSDCNSTEAGVMGTCLSAETCSMRMGTERGTCASVVLILIIHFFRFYILRGLVFAVSKSSAQMKPRPGLIIGLPTSGIQTILNPTPWTGLRQSLSCPETMILSSSDWIFLTSRFLSNIIF